MTSPVTPTPVTAGPPVPDIGDPESTFDSMLQAYHGWQKDSLQPEINTLAGQCYTNAVAANESAAAAANSKASAAASETSAALFAASAVNSAGTSATSTTSLTLSAGSKTLTIQTGKLFAIGQWLVIAATANPLHQMTGVVTAHDNATGTISVNVNSAEHVTGAGTYAAWTVSVVGRAAQGAGLQRVAATVSGAYTIVGAAGLMHDLTLTGNVTLTFPSAADSTSVAFDIILNQTSLYTYNTVTWPTIDWSLVGGIPPTLDKRHTLIRFVAINGLWYAHAVQKAGLPALSFVGYGWSSSITEPGGTQEGDLFIAIAHGPSVSSSDAIAGWSTINDQPAIAGGHTSKLYYRLRGSTSLTGTVIPNADAADSSPFFAVYRGYNTVNLANTDGEIVAASATVSRTISVDGAVLVWAADLFATTEPTVTLPDESFLTTGDTATYFKTRAKAGLISAGQSISVQDNHASYGTNMWRVVVTAV